jgi:serine phosphatase RsbU (regulator of sigma subunit)
VSYDEIALPLATDDVFVFCSDGVPVEAEQRGRGVHVPAIDRGGQKVRSRPAGEIVRAIVRQVEEHRAGFPPNDDVTVVVLRNQRTGSRLGGPENGG